MASLLILKGSNQWQDFPLEADQTIIGRNPNCHVVIPITSVSREHARIIRERGRYYIEDLQSRNGTFVNSRPIHTRTLLSHNDRIRICDFLCTFQDADSDDEHEETSSTVEAVLSQSSKQLLESQPAEKLKALLEISSELSNALQLDQLLPRIVEILFRVFRQADRCFIIQAEPDTGRLLPRVVKSRRLHDESKDRFSRSIVKRCLQTGQAFLSDDAANDKNIPLTQSVVEFRIRSVMCAPLCAANGEAFGVIQLDTQDRSAKFTEDDLKLLVGVTSQASIAMENARLHQELVDQDRARRDLELAHEVQFSFLPRQLPVMPGYEFFAHYEPALAVGGDYYDFIPLPSAAPWSPQDSAVAKEAPGRLAIVIGDVAGKGVPAALLMAKLSGDARFCLLTEPDAARAITRLNQVIFKHLETMDRFITLAVAVLDPRQHKVTLVNAGHLNPLFYQRATGQVSEVGDPAAAGLPLGIEEGTVYGACEVSFQPGDCLLFYTDGIPDAHNARDIPFGSKAPQTILAGGGPYSPRTMGERLVKAVKQHVAGFHRYDDVTLVCFGRTE